MNSLTSSPAGPAALGLREQADAHPGRQPEHAVASRLRRQRDAGADDPAALSWRNARETAPCGRRRRCATSAEVARPAGHSARASTSSSIASLFAAGADQDYVAAQVGHEDVTTTSRIYRYVLQCRQRGEIGRRRQLAMRESAAEMNRAGPAPLRVTGR
jgi:integrase